MEGVKIISIKFQECIDDETGGETVTDSDNLNESFNFSDISHEILDVSSSSDFILNMDDSKGKSNSKVKAELKLLRQSIKIKDDKIESLHSNHTQCYESQLSVMLFISWGVEIAQYRFSR